MEPPHGYPMFIPGDFQSLANDGGADDLVPFHRYVTSAVVGSVHCVSSYIPCGIYMVFITAGTVL